MNVTRLAGLAMLAATVILLAPVEAGCEEGDPAANTVTAQASATVKIERDDLSALVAGSNDFAFAMYGRLAGDGNLFFSPYSISTALAMTAAGARGATEQEMAATLGFPTETIDGVETPISRERVAESFGQLQEGLAAAPETRGYELNVANSLWGQESYPFSYSFLDLIDSNYGGGFNRADFINNAEMERMRINAWVEDETRERIQNLIPPGGVNSLTTLVLVNAVYFKGQWARQFAEEDTQDDVFHGESGDATVPLMRLKSDFRYYVDSDVQVLEMPYSGDEVSMLVVLPDEESPMTLAALESNLSSEMLDGWAAGLSEQEVTVYLPRFEMTWGTENIADHLRAMGIRTAFGAEADFSGMSGGRELFIGPVFHKAFVAVNEEGTEAAAATAVVMKRLAIRDPNVFRADRPFMFLIRDNATGGILFMGRVVDLG